MLKKGLCKADPFRFRNENSEKRNPQVRNKLTRAALAAVVVGPMAALGGCASFSKDNVVVGSTPDTYKTRHPIVIDEKEQTIDIPISSASYDLQRGQAGVINGFIDRYKASASGKLTIMMPSGSPNDAAGRTISARVVELIEQKNVPRSRIRMTRYQAHKHGTSAPVRLSFVAVKANVRGCGKWPEDLAGTNVENKNYHNFGCSTQSNLAAMIANPADLLEPRGSTSIDAERRQNVIETFRTEGGAL